MLQIKPVFRCDENLKSQFKASRCLLTISVGQETHEDERFSATLALIERSFSSCTIALHDSLQRHTIALNEKDEANCFYEKAVWLGDLWLERNRQYIKALRIPVSIIRWNDFLNDSAFLVSKANILSALTNDASYCASFKMVIKDYLTRHLRRLKDPEMLDLKRAEKLCMDYLIEECAGMCLWPKTGCQFEIYTAKHNAAMIETQKKFLSIKVLQSVAVGFNYRPNLRPQSFYFQKCKQNFLPIFSVE